MENIDLEKFLLDEFALSSNEVALYIALLKCGHSTILELAEHTGINRATTHVNVESLTKKRLVTQIKKGQGSRRTIMAEPPEKLHTLLKEQKAKIEAAEQQLPQMITKLSNLKELAQKNSGMEIRYYKGKNEVRFIYDEVLKANEIRTYANTAELLKIFPINPQKFITAHRTNPKMRIWEIMEDSSETRAYVKQMSADRFFFRLVTECLPLPPTTDYIIFDGKVAIIEAPHGVISGILIENKNFYASSVAIHKFVWDYLPEL